VNKTEIKIQELTKGWLVSLESVKRYAEYACQTRDEVYALVKELMEEES